ncbi:KOW domain-containing protein [Clostridium botulinum]|uniref:50S ribosomal protein L14 n=1 Tax=Clostridium botulinum C/D str. DC5 TaxID=1443128 RepID=A0A0A0I560_CLOBO|nr:KOW domain-containing RNA-binding protein [Clostridium botulinum]KEI05008.1 hypothetical protein Z952_05595 [Clostridium botulinum C/D str. BKT75002]KEI11852.1 hypothetical protein Z954_06780 [Clostridium botulinum C/D str. BKT2873]KGM93934.1 50S ribosomal protein L14 [Clostridium botulinum D str. CCUG 7971]KGM96544.1 50S ribosomal protein L14 [Clostridium botulinum C/D str. DC5]KOC46412.1 50S ribosomal protein L14 [Clostridium botulinum]
MNYNELIGRIACSKTGRDQGKQFIILNVIDNKYVNIIDGDLRTVRRPKRKKIKHLKITDEVIENANELLISNDSIINIKVKKFLKNRDAIKEG